MPRPNDITNGDLLTRMSVEGWVGLILVIVGGIVSHTVLANDSKHAQGQIAVNTATIHDVQDSVQIIKTDIAIIKAEQRYMNDTMLKIQHEQQEKLSRIEKLLEEK
jgi:hypothetical protein